MEKLTKTRLIDLAVLLSITIFPFILTSAHVLVTGTPSKPASAGSFEFFLL